MSPELAESGHGGSAHRRYLTHHSKSLGSWIARSHGSPFGSAGFLIGGASQRRSKIVSPFLAPAVHFKDHLHFQKGGFRIRPLRNLSDANNVFIFAMTIAVHSFQVVLKHYRPEEHGQGAFQKRYLERWREAFLSVPQLTYRYE